MRKILPLSIALFSCMLSVCARSSVVWHSRGEAVSSGPGNTHTSLYVKGSMKFSGSPSMSLTGSRIKLTGDFLNDVDRGTSGGSIFTSSASGSQGIIEFCGDAPQSITSSGTTVTDLPSKLDNYINFPDVDINNSSHVTLDSRLGAKTQNILLSKGWLVLDSKTAQVNVDGGSEVNPLQESVLAHLLVEGSIDYNDSQWANKSQSERGFIQVNLKIPAESSHAKSVVGFGIPFSGMYNDYFMFNTLLAPSNERFVGNGPLVDPKTRMTAGKGYVVGIDLRGTDPVNYPKMEDYPLIDFTQRAKDGYSFNRHYYTTYAPDNHVFGHDASHDAYRMEKLNTEDVRVSLSEGYNYLSNPYTCPLNIDRLLGENAAQDTWKIHSGEWSDAIDTWNRVWVLAPNSVAAPGWEPTTSVYTYNYQVAMKTGGTYIDNDNVSGVTALAPLQMFVIYSRKAMDITIPRQERVMGTPRFLRNALQEDRRRDDFIIEFRDMSSNTTDRASIVLRSQAELDRGAYSNVERLESASSDDKEITRMAYGEGTDFAQSLASQIYTKDPEGNALTVQFLPLETTGRTVLYHIPSSQAQPLHILGLRLNTKDRVGQVWLEDRKYNREIELTPQTVYETDSEPNDSNERFALRFMEGSGIDGGQESGSLMAYDKDRSIIVEGFQEKDMGCKLELFDVRGRLIVQKRADAHRTVLHEDVPEGLYIVKAHTAKGEVFKVLVR